MKFIQKKEKNLNDKILHDPMGLVCNPNPDMGYYNLLRNCMIKIHFCDHPKEWQLQRESEVFQY